YERDDNGQGTDAVKHWFSGGLRPIYNFTDNVALAFEAGADHVNSQPDNLNGTLYKFTIAPELRFNNKFMGRPELRAFVTYAFWGDDFKGSTGGSAYSDDTSGLTVGVQMEAWW
ncbi:MAG: carbohydrate porin, partial [Candidatus Omnitrophota bacterium]